MKILLQPAFIIASLLFASQAFAQFDTAEVLGAVKDPTGAGVPKADVTLRNQNTGIESKTVTGGEGGYNFFNVKVGKYTVTVEAQGFSRTSTADVAWPSARGSEWILHCRWATITGGRGDWGGIGSRNGLRANTGK